MIDITRAQATQTTRDGTDEEWRVSLEGEALYTLPSHFTVQETFLVRDIAEKMMKLAVAEVRAKEQSIATKNLDTIVTNGNSQLDALKRENMRLATALEDHLEVT